MLEIISNIEKRIFRFLKRPLWRFSIKWNGINRFVLACLTISCAFLTLAGCISLVFYPTFLSGLSLVFGWPLTLFFIFWCAVRGGSIKMLECDYRDGILDSDDYRKYLPILENNKRELDLIEERLKRHQSNDHQ